MRVLVMELFTCIQAASTPASLQVYLPLLSACVSSSFGISVTFPGGASVEEPACPNRRQETQVPSLGWEDPLEEGMTPTPVLLPRESHGQRSLKGNSPWGRKSQTQLSN